MWHRVGWWRAHGIVGPGNKFGAVTQMRYCTPIFNRVNSKYFFRVGLCSHMIHFCRLRGGRAIIRCGRDDDDRVDPSPRNHQWNTCGKYWVSGRDLRAYLRTRGITRIARSSSNEDHAITIWRPRWSAIFFSSWKRIERQISSGRRTLHRAIDCY